MRELEIIKPIEFGIEEKQANELMGNLPEIINERQVMEQQYSEIIKMDIEDSATAKKARDLRLIISKNRTQGINVWHKTTKDFFLKGGQFVDAIKRKEVAVNERMEEQLEQIEKYAEIKEQKRLDELESIRLDKLKPFSEFVPFGANIRNISDEDFDKILNGAKLQFNAKIEAEKKAEEERIAKEKAEAERIRLQEIENAKLKAEAEKREKEIEAERKKQAEILAKQQAEAEAKLKAEQEAKAKIETELRLKKEAEAKAETDRLAEIERQKKEADKLAKAPIKKQLSVWVDSFLIPELNIDNEKKTLITEKFEAFKKWAKAEIENL
jgi:colicin import membrane protein